MPVAMEAGNYGPLPEVVQMKDNDGVEQTEGEGGRRGIVDSAKGVIGSAREQASRSVDVMTGFAGFSPLSVDQSQVQSILRLTRNIGLLAPRT